MPDYARFHRFTVLVLIVTLGVIVWGGYVRATGSGAGCGSHWPTCDGEILPLSFTAKKLVEFTHRVTSGLALLLVAAQVIWAWRIFPRGHAVRRMATIVFVFMIIEALVGAGLVIYEMVGGNPSTMRAPWMAAHLLNTFILLATMALLSHRARRASAPETIVVSEAPLPGAEGLWRALVVGMLAVLVVAVSGAVVALGDTLFPAESLAHGFAQDLSPTSHLFLRLRVVHPVLAVIGGIYLLVLAAIIAGRDAGSGQLRRLATRVAAVVLVQLALGLLNLLLLAPTLLQLLHLLLADLVWLALLALSINVWEAARGSQPAKNLAVAAASVRPA